MYTATSGLMFETPEDAARAADLLLALFERAQALQASGDAPQGDEIGDAGDIQTLNGTADGGSSSIPERSDDPSSGSAADEHRDNVHRD